MSQDTPQDDITKRRVVYELPDAEAVSVERDVEFRAADAGPLAMDIYYPPGSTMSQRLPAIISVAGYPDTGTKVPCKFKEMMSSISWARLFAASGVVAITYTNREPVGDLHALLEHLQRHASSLGIDENRIGVRAASGNVPLALSILMRGARVPMRCAVLCYGFTLDLDGATSVAEAANQWGFVNPCAGRSVDDLAGSIPLFIARAGQDGFPHLNETLDRFVAKVVTRNLPLSFVNHSDGPHAFDLFHDSETSREVIRQILAFTRFNLRRDSTRG